MGDLVTYQIDGLDRIEKVSASWAPFALANEGSSVAADVVGHSLWEFICDDTTRQVYRALIGRVRDGRTVAFSYRCDSPALRRFMKMTMRPGGHGAVAFDSLVVKTEPRIAPALFTSPGKQAGNLLKVCGWCKRVAVADDWLEVEAAVDPLGLLAGSPPSGITHGMCPPCYARVMAETEAA